jgi:hypothetical protein
MGPVDIQPGEADGHGLLELSAGGVLEVRSSPVACGKALALGSLFGVITHLLFAVRYTADLLTVQPIAYSTTDR